MPHEGTPLGSSPSGPGGKIRQEKLLATRKLKNLGLPCKTLVNKMLLEPTLADKTMKTHLGNPVTAKNIYLLGSEPSIAQVSPCDKVTSLIVPANTIKCIHGPCNSATLKVVETSFELRVKICQDIYIYIYLYIIYIYHLYNKHIHFATRISQRGL